MARKEPEWLRELRALDKGAEIVFGKRLTYYGALLIEKLSSLASTPQAPPQVDPNDPYTILDIPPNSPGWLVRLAYKEKAKKAHPDLPTGSEEEMKRINDAFDRIKKERGLKNQS